MNTKTSSVFPYSPFFFSPFTILQKNISHLRLSLLFANRRYFGQLFSQYAQQLIRYLKIFHYKRFSYRLLFLLYKCITNFIISITTHCRPKSFFFFFFSSYTNSLQICYSLFLKYPLSKNKPKKNINIQLLLSLSSKRQRFAKFSIKKIFFFAVLKLSSSKCLLNLSISLRMFFNSGFQRQWT